MPSSATASQSRQSHAERTGRSDRRMLEAAISLIVERGPEKTTLKEVGERAGYSRGLAGYRFGSKQGLFEFVMRAIGEDWLSRLTHVTRGKSGFDAMSAAINAHFDFCIKGSDQARAFYTLWFYSVHPGSDIPKIVDRIQQRRIQDVSQWIEDVNQSRASDKKVEATNIAGQFNASIIGIACQWLMHPKDLSHIRSLHDQLITTMSLYLNQEN